MGKGLKRQYILATAVRWRALNMTVSSKPHRANTGSGEGHLPSHRIAVAFTGMLQNRGCLSFPATFPGDTLGHTLNFDRPCCKATVLNTLTAPSQTERMLTSLQNATEDEYVSGHLHHQAAFHAFLFPLARGHSWAGLIMTTLSGKRKVNAAFTQVLGFGH